MNETILLVGHGSRDERGNKEIEIFAQNWRQRHPRRRIELCFIEFAEILLAEGLDRAAAAGGNVVVVPLILNAAGHVKMEIPEAIEEARERHPEVQFIYARHLGAVDPLLGILLRNLQGAARQLDFPDPRTTGVILLGRGSSDRAANGEVAKMARWLFEESEHDLVDVAFTGITHPRLESVVARHERLGMKQIFILPYYLFTGTLIARIGRQTDHLREQYPGVRFSLADYFGFEDEIYCLLDERVEEALGGRAAECDGCKYRESAEHHQHGAHS